MGKQRPPTPFELTLWQRFSKLPNDVVDDESVDGSMMAVYCVFIRLSNSLLLGDRTIYGSYVGIRTIAASTGFSDRKIQYAIRRLEGRGLIKRHKKLFGNSVTELIDLEIVYPNVCRKKSPLPVVIPRDLRIAGR